MLFHSHHSATIWPRPPTCWAWTRGRQLCPEPDPVIHGSIDEGLCRQNNRGKKTWRERIHVLRKLNVRKGCTVPSPLSWPFAKKSDGTNEFATTDSMDGCNVLPETQFVGSRLRVDATWVLSVGGSLPPWGAADKGQSLTSNRLYGLHS